MQFFTFGDSDVDFGEIAFIKIEHQGYDSKPLFVYFHIDLLDLFFVKEKFSGCPAVSAEMAIGGFQFSDMRIHQVELPFDKAAKGIIEVGTLCTQCFNLRALQYDACFKLFEYFIIMSGFFVLCNKSDRQMKPWINLFLAL